MPQQVFDRSAPRFIVTVRSETGAARLLVQDGKGLGKPTPRNAARVLSFEYTDRERGADKLSITVDNFDLSNFDDPVWKKGNKVQVKWGYPGRMAPERLMVIRKVVGFDRLRIEAAAEDVLLNLKTRNRLFENMKRSDVVRQLASEAGYGPDQQFIEDTEVVLPSIQQARLTDAQFLRRLANLEGFEWYVDFDGFHFHQRQLGQRPVRTYTYYHGNFGEIMSISVENDVTAKPGRTKKKGRDPIEKEDIEGDGRTSTSETFSKLEGQLGELQRVLGLSEDDAPSPEASEGAKKRKSLSDNLEVFDSATVGLGALSRQAANRAAYGGGSKNVAQEEVRPSSQSNKKAMQREAEGRQRRFQQVAVKLDVTAIGDPRQLAKTVVKLEGVGKRLSQKYYVKEVKHSIGTSGYEMTMKWVSDGHGGHATESTKARGLTLIDPGPSQTGRKNKKNAPDEGPADPANEVPELVSDYDPQTGVGVFSPVHPPLDLGPSNGGGEET